MVTRTFKHETESRGLSFDVHLDPRLDRTLLTDAKRVQQVLKNLLSNAFKFTSQGGVRLTHRPKARWSPDHPMLGHRSSLRGRRFRYRHPAREAAHHLRSVPAGRCEHEPQVRRHGPWARHQPRAGESARRRNSAAQHAGRRQHVHALPAAPIRRSDRSLRLADNRLGPFAPRAHGLLPLTVAARAGTAGRRRARRPRADLGRRHDAAHRRGRPALRAHSPGPRPGSGTQGARCHARRRRAGARRSIPPDGRLAGRLPPRHARLDRPQSAEARPRYATHSGPDHHAGRGSPARPRARCVLIHHEADECRRTRSSHHAADGLRQAAPEASAHRRRQSGGTVEHQGAARRQRSRHCRRRYRRCRADGPDGGTRATASCSIYGCPTCRDSKCSLT